tara:strand:+ start:650 stop:988 length:339 start_codon:yes stop_codon:yes gene_type:complete
MSKDWQEALQEEVSYQELEEKLTKRTAQLVDTLNELSDTYGQLRESNELLVKVQNNLNELEKVITERKHIHSHKAQNAVVNIINPLKEKALKIHKEETDAINDKRNQDKVVA